MNIHQSVIECTHERACTHTQPRTDLEGKSGHVRNVLTYLTNVYKFCLHLLSSNNYTNIMYTTIIQSSIITHSLIIRLK